jgi:hypothetical protein
MIRPSFQQADADVAQLVEQLIRNQKVGGSIPPVGTSETFLILGKLLNKQFLLLTLEQWKTLHQ